MATIDLLKIKVFWNKDHDVTNNILSCDSNYIVYVIRWPKFGNSCISLREVIITSVLLGFELKNTFFKGGPWFKLNNLRLILGIALKFYISVAKGLKLKVKNFYGIIPTFVEVTVEKLVEGPFLPLCILNRVKKIT